VGQFVQGHSLHVHLQRDPAVGVLHKLLDGLHIFPVRLQQGAEGVSEGVPVDAFVNAVRSSNRPINSRR